MFNVCCVAYVAWFAAPCRSNCVRCLLSLHACSARVCSHVDPHLPIHQFWGSWPVRCDGATTQPHKGVQVRAWCLALNAAEHVRSDPACSPVCCCCPCLGFSCCCPCYTTCIPSLRPECPAPGPGQCLGQQQHVGLHAGPSHTPLHGCLPGL